MLNDDGNSPSEGNAGPAVETVAHIATIGLSWNANFLQKRTDKHRGWGFCGIECKVNDTAAKLLEVGTETEMVAFTEPEYLSRDRIDKKYKPRIAKIAQAIGYEITEERMAPRWPEGHAQHDPNVGIMYYKLTRNPAITVHQPRTKTDEEQRMIGYNNKDAVQEGEIVEVRYTSNFKAYRDIATVVRINANSIRYHCGSFETTQFYKQNTLGNATFKIGDGQLDAVKAEIAAFNKARDDRDAVIDEAMKGVTFEIVPAIRVHDKFGNEINSIDMMELAHPTTAESIKAHCQLEASEERSKIGMNALGAFVDQKLREHGMKELGKK